MFDLFLFIAYMTSSKIDDIFDIKSCWRGQKVKCSISNEGTLWDKSNDMYYNKIMEKLTKMYTFECPLVWNVPKYGHSLVTWLGFQKNFTSSECQINFRKIQWISSSSYKPFWFYEQFFNGEVPPVEIGLKLQNLSNNGPIDWGKYVRPQNQNLSLKFTLHRAYLDYVFVFRVY